MEIEKQITLINETIELLQDRVDDMLIDPSLDEGNLATMNDCIDRLMLTAGELLCNEEWDCYVKTTDKEKPNDEKESDEVKARCPKCGNKMVQTNQTITTNPPQFIYRCEWCRHEISSNIVFEQ